ncbi:MAG: alpha-ketoglutarate-dependent dioxygenase AlkB [Microthrixaceae bacterium]
MGFEPAIDRRAAVEHIALDDTSWVDLCRRFVPDATTLMHDMLTTVPWRPSSVFRYEVDLLRRRMEGSLRGIDLPVVRQTGMHLRSRYRRPMEGPGVLLYRDGSDAIGFHRDRAMRWLDDTLVAIVVLGMPRPFVLRPRTVAVGASSRDVDLSAGDGDLLVMGGRTQADWLHGVPPHPGARPRISMTWRWTSRRGRPDDSVSYGAAVRFGDSGRVGPQRRRAAPQASVPRSNGR